MGGFAEWSLVGVGVHALSYEAWLALNVEVLPNEAWLALVLRLCWIALETLPDKARLAPVMVWKLCPSSFSDQFYILQQISLA